MDICGLPWITMGFTACIRGENQNHAGFPPLQSKPSSLFLLTGEQSDTLGLLSRSDKKKRHRRNQRNPSL